MGIEKSSKVALKTDSITKRFGGLVAVDDLSFEIHEGQICALIGPNGSGKTTVLNVITGIYPVDGGRVEFYGSPIQDLPCHAICWRGIARTFQNIRILGSQTVFENALLGKGYGNRGAGVFEIILDTPKHRREMAAYSEEVDEILDFVGLAESRDEQARNLPYGKQRVLEIARALVTKPKLLLLDEPAAGMNPAETENLMRLITDIREEFGVTILLIEHEMKVVMGICERMTVLDHGEIIAEGTPAEIQRNERVIKAYLGGGAVVGNKGS